MNEWKPVWDNEAIRAVLSKIPAARAEFSTEDMHEEARVLTACCMATDPGSAHPSEIKAMLTGLKNGYGDWQRTIADAIMDADLPEDHRCLLYGAFRMAEAFLFDIEGHNRPAG